MAKEKPQTDIVPVPKPDLTRLRRAKPVDPEDVPEKDTRVSQGAVDKALDLAFNPTREKLREVTIIDKTQARLFPILDVVNMLWNSVIEVALWRQDKEAYAKMFGKLGRSKPNEINLPLDETMYRTAQWQKSQGGANLTKITDIALAETETRSGEDMDSGINDPAGWKD